MTHLGLVLTVFSFCCFTISVFQVASPYWNKLISAGLALMLAAIIFGGLASLKYLNP